MLRALEAGAGRAARSAALPWILGWRWLDRRRAARAGARAPSRAWKVAADELFFALELVGTAVIAPRERHRVRAELDAALDYLDRRGWIDDPAGYHRAPPAPRRVEVRQTRVWGGRLEHARFASGWRPHRGEPGRERWLAYAPNRTAHAWLLRHADDAPRPWVVCVPGYRMGHPAVDLLGFRARWLHRELGLNVAIPVLPFHGPRRVGRRGGDGFLSGDLLDTLHAKAQGVWDVRRLVAWLRARGAPGVALYGVSLGAFTSGVVAGLERGLDCVIAGIPAADFVEILRAHAPTPLLRASERAGFPWREARHLLRVVSPLALAPRVAPDRLYVYAALDDRLAPPSQARALWEHWGRPRIDWYRGSHCSFVLERAPRRLVREALAEAGLVHGATAPHREEAPAPANAQMATPSSGSTVLGSRPTRRSSTPSTVIRQASPSR